MDPSSFTKTSFCDKEIDNITTNEDKQYILQLLKLRTNGQTYNSRYAKIYNEQYSKNLSNPHILCLKSSGTPYLLFLTQINDINYCFLIDKKIKDDYEYPKIFVIPYQFSHELYTGTLFETELLRDKDNHWSLLIGDIYMFKGELMKNIIIIERINTIHSIFTNQFSPTDFQLICPISIKKYFDLKDISHALHDYSKTLMYDIRGVYFIPIKTSYSNILHLFTKKQKQSLKNTKNKPKTYNFQIEKSLKPDVYDLYAKGHHNLVKKGVAYVKDLKKSMYLYTITKSKENVIVECFYNEIFKKWEPIQMTTNPISLVQDI